MSEYTEHFAVWRDLTDEHLKGVGYRWKILRAIARATPAGGCAIYRPVQVPRRPCLLGRRSEEGQPMPPFTPTDLLRQYVKEAFARENIPASDLRIHTWADYRRELARQRFGVLRTAAGGGNFVMKEDLSSLQRGAQQTQWFEDFDIWQAEAFWADLQAHAKNLAANLNPAISKVGARLNGIVGGGASPASAQFEIALWRRVCSSIRRLRGRQVR
jgi:hypothetical protein